MFQAVFYNEKHRERGRGYSMEFKTRKEAEEWLKKLIESLPYTKGTVIEI